MKKGANIYLNKKEIEMLIDLEQRLVNEPFEQKQEDRLIIGHILDKVERNI